MRNVVILNDSGMIFPYEKSDKIDPKSSNFIKNSIFKLNGNIQCFPFLNLLKEYYNKVNKNGNIINKLNSINDKFNIWIIFNQINEDKHIWNINKFLSLLFKNDIYAENICMFISEDELNNGNIDVDYLTNEEFKQTINDICECIISETSDYLDALNIIIDSDNIVKMRNTEVKDFHDDYIGKRSSTNFTELINLDNGNILLRKNGVIMYVNDEQNSAQLYFSTQYAPIDDLNIFKENIC